MLSYTWRVSYLVGLSLIGGFVRAISNFLHVAPEMLDEAIKIMSSMVEERERLDKKLMQEFNPTWSAKLYNSRLPAEEEMYRICGELALLDGCLRDLKDDTCFKREQIEIETLNGPNQIGNTELTSKRKTT